MHLKFSQEPGDQAHAFEPGGTVTLTKGVLVASHLPLSDAAYVPLPNATTWIPHYLAGTSCLPSFRFTWRVNPFVGAPKPCNTQGVLKTSTSPCRPRDKSAVSIHFFIDSMDQCILEIYVLKAVFTNTERLEEMSD